MKNVNVLLIKKGLILVVILIFLFSSYKIATYVFYSYESKNAYTEIRTIYKSDAIKVIAQETANPLTMQDSVLPSVTHPASQIQGKFKDLVKQNQDIVGWVKIDGTTIDYPVTHTTDNEYYLNYDASKNKNPHGSIFMDYRNKLDDSDRNTILYGHSMADGSMFGDILYYESKWNFENHSIIAFDTIYKNEKWKIFSTYTSDVNFDYIKTDFKSIEEYKSFLDTIKAKSIYKSDVDLTAKDRILTLSTCSAAFDNARFVIQAKLIQ